MGVANHKSTQIKVRSTHCLLNIAQRHIRSGRGGAALLKLGHYVDMTVMAASNFNIDCPELRLDCDILTCQRPALHFITAHSQGRRFRKQ